MHYKVIIASKVAPVH